MHLLRSVFPTGLCSRSRFTSLEVALGQCKISLSITSIYLGSLPALISVQAHQPTRDVFWLTTVVGWSTNKPPHSSDLTPGSMNGACAIVTWKSPEA